MVTLDTYGVGMICEHVHGNNSLGKQDETMGLVANLELKEN